MINPECISKIINNLDAWKATQQGGVPTKNVKDNKDLFLREGVLPDELIDADIKPVYKKESRNEKENCRSVSVLPYIWKIFKRCIHDQLKDYFDQALSKYQCEFRKGFSTQHCLLAMIDKIDLIVGQLLLF